MNLKSKIGNYGFWISLASAIVIMLKAFGIQLVESDIMHIVTAVLGVLVVLGIISDADKGQWYGDE